MLWFGAIAITCSLVLVASILNRLSNAKISACDTNF